MKNIDCGLSTDNDILDTAGEAQGPAVPGEEIPPDFMPLALIASLAKGDAVLLKDSDPNAMSNGDGISIPRAGLLGVETVELGCDSSFTDDCSSLTLSRSSCRAGSSGSAVMLTVEESTTRDSLTLPSCGSSASAEAASSSLRDVVELD